MSPPFNIVAVLQKGRLQYEAVLLAASLRATNPGFAGRLILAMPEPGPLWPEDPTVTDAPTLEALSGFGAEILRFPSALFGAAYPNGNKIEMLAHLPDAPFLFLDTDTLVTGRLDSLDIDFARPSASMRRTGTWPEPDLYGPDYDGIWGALYRRFGLDFQSSLDLGQPADYWQRYLYFNAGWFFHESPARFGALFAEFAQSIWTDPPPELATQTLDPWLDQIALPLVIHALGGGRPGPGLDGLDGGVTCHWRILGQFFATADDTAVAVMEEVAAQNRVKKVLRAYPAFHHMLYRGGGRAARALIPRDPAPSERMVRRVLKREGLLDR